MNLPVSLSKLGVTALLLGAVAFSSCEKEADEMCGGTPAIGGVTLPAKRDAAVTSGNLADWVIIQGNNFCNVKKVLFNDVEASLKDAYITQTEITLRIPRSVPKTVTNKITVVTDGGSAEKAYTVTIPPLVVTAMTNEYALAGEKVAITGQNFDLYGVTPEKGKVLINGTAAAITRSTADSIFFVMPANATAGAIKVVDANGTEKEAAFRYKDNRNIIFSYDQGGSVWGGDTFITEDAAPGPISGKYIRIKQTIGAWAWTEFSANNVAVPADIVANPQNYQLKFEVNTIKPFNANVIKLMIDGNAGDTNTYQWTSTMPFNTLGKWKTVSIPLNSIVNKGLEASKPQHEFKFIFHGDGALDADISFDNFRIVPKG